MLNWIAEIFCAIFSASRSRSLAAILAASFLLAGCQKLVVYGYVLDGAVADAKIQIKDAASGALLGEGKTDDKGYYEVMVSEAEAYRVESTGGYLNGQPYRGTLRGICSQAQAAHMAELRANASPKPFPSDKSPKNQGSTNGRPWRPDSQETNSSCNLTPLTTLAVLAADAGMKKNTQLTPWDAYTQAQANQSHILQLPADDAFVMDFQGQTQDAVDLVRLRARIGDGADLDALLNEILADSADGSLDGETRVYFPHALTRADVLIQHVQALMQGDPSIVQTPDAQLDQILAPSRTPAAQVRERQLEHNHDLVLHATDPEPSWISTRASTQMVIGQPGESYNVDLVMLDGGGNVLGPVDSSKLRIELRIQRNETTFDYIPTEFQADYVGWDASTPGRLNIHVPVDLIRGRLLIGVRPKFSDPGQAAIAERWSIPILVDVWPTKPEATVVDETSVYYPLGSDAHFRTGSAFDATAITTALQQAAADPTLAGQPLKALVVNGLGLQEGQLVDYRLPDSTGGIYPYGGRVVKVIAGTGGQQLVLVNFEVLSTYDVLMGNDDQFIKQGVMPEFVTYRSGDALPATGIQPTAPSYFGPASQATIQSGLLDFFKEYCDAGSAAMVVTPFFRFDVDAGVSAGVEYSVGVNGAAVSCKFDAAPGSALNVPFGGPIGVVLQKLVGTGVTLAPYGEIKLGLDAGSGFTNLQIKGGASYPGGITAPKWGWSGSLGSGLDGTPITVKATLGGEVGLEANLAAAKISLPGFGNYDVSLTGKAGWYSGFTGEALNAAAAKSGANSSLGTEFGFKVGTSASGGLINILKYLGAKAKVNVDYVIPGEIKKVNAGYNVGDVYDDAQGQASAVIQPSSTLVRDFTTGNGSADGYASLANSSVYNDPNLSITYDVSECQADGGTISTPLIGCLNGFFCGAVNAPAKLCGGQLSVDPIHGSGNEGDTVTATSWATVTQSADPSAPPLAITVSGSPFSPTPTSFQLAPGNNQTLTATATCPSRGVYRGTINANSSGASDSKEDLLTCACKPGATDCDRMWGDPYLVTADGMAYDFIASGDYILQEVVDDNNNPIPGLQVQGRFLPGYDVSWPSSAALQVGDDVVEISSTILGHPPVFAIGMEVRVNGQYVFPPAVNGTGGSWESLLKGRTIRLPGGGLIFVDSFVQKYFTYKPSSLTVVWPANGPFPGYAVQLKEPDGVSADPQPFLSMQFIRPTTHTGHERGMMGNNDGDPSNDFQRRNGDILGQDTAMSWTALYGLFGGDWLVRPQECLFADGCTGQPDFPTTADVLTPDQRAIGEAACANLTGFYQDACIHDVGLSGNVSLVQSYYANSTDLNWMASQLQTPGVDLPVYRLSEGVRVPLSGSTILNPIYRLSASVNRVSGDGKFLLSIRPPRGATVTFTDGQPGSLDTSLTATGDLSTSVDVHCGQPDPNWATLGDAWQQDGALQLWALDPLSGFAKQMEGEISLSCSSAGHVIAAGNSHSLAFTNGGSLWAWGRNSNGQLGDGTTISRSSPAAVDLSKLAGRHIVSVSAWGNDTVILDDSGGVWGFGENWGGLLGTGSASDLYAPTPVNLSSMGSAEVKTVEMGADHTLALDQAGGVWAWGENAYGQLGDGTTLTHLTPAPVTFSSLGGATVLSVAAGNRYSMALDDTGRLWGWGLNNFGQLGDGTNTNRSSPTEVNLAALNGAKAVSLAAGAVHSVALDDQGRLWAWGYNAYGQLGDGTTTNRSTPVPVDLTALNSAKVVSVAAGAYQTFAVDDRGRLWAWGNNYNGQLGDGSWSYTHTTPVPVNITALGGAKVVSVAVGDYHTLALDDKGRLWGWGANWWGEVGDGSNYQHNTPVLIGMLNGGVTVSAAVPGAVTLVEGHELKLGKLSIMNNRFGSTAAGLQMQGAGFSLNVPGQSSAVVPGGESDLSLYAGCDAPSASHSAGYSLIDDKGSVVYSGSVNITCVADVRQSVSLDGTGALSLSLTNAGASNVSLLFTPAPGLSLSGITSWEGSLAQQTGQSLSVTGLGCPFSGVRDLGVLSFLDSQGQAYAQQKVTAWGQAVCGSRVAAGDGHTLAIYGAGQLAAWGANFSGQLGDGTSTQRNSPVAVNLSPLNDAKVVSAIAGANYSLALDGNGALWAWGNNVAGQLGTQGTSGGFTMTGSGFGTLTPSGFSTASPPAAVNLTALGGARVLSAAAGVNHTLALDQTGRLWAWGDNTYGELGDGTTTNRSTPVAASLSAKVVFMAAGQGYSLALDNAGQLWSWGANSDGQLGDGSTTGRLTPVAVDLSGLTDARVVSMVAGQSHALALDDQGRLWGWGNNGVGQLADGTTTNRSAPVLMDLRPLGGAGVVSMAAGNQYSLVLDDQGQLWAAGANQSGELGDGSTQGHTSLSAVDQSALGGARIVDVAAGATHALALDENGRLWAWGYNANGQVGDGTTVSRLTPVLIGATSGGSIQVSSSTVPAAATLTEQHDAALGKLTVSNGMLTQVTLQLQGAGFGLDAPGQTTALAPYGDTTHTLYDRCSTPGTQQTLAYSLLDSAGNVVYSGSVNITCLVDVRSSATPISGGGLILSLTDAGSTSAWLRFTPATGVTLSGTTTTTWEGTVVQQGQQTLPLTGISCPFSGVQTLGVLEFLNSQGQVYGQKTVTAAPAICQKGVHVSTGTYHSLAIDASGRVWAWGSDLEAQLGTSPSNLLGLGVSQLAPTPSPVNVSGQVVSVAAGFLDSFALDTTGTVWAWGTGYSCEVSPYTWAPKAVNLTALGDAKVVSVMAGGSHVAVLDETGQVWAWGSDTDGQLGNGTTSSTSVCAPTAVDLSPLGGSSVVSVATGGYHTLAIDDTGRLWAWGNNAYGQLGDGTTVTRSSPVAVNLGALGGAKVVAIAAGLHHSLLVDDAGRVWGWGDNVSGDLGDGTATVRTTPVAVDLSALNGAHVVSIAAGQYHSLALDDTGRLWAWGSNGDGQLGNPVIGYANSLTPTPVDMSSWNGAKAVSIASGYFHNEALDSAGHLWGWGNTTYGQVGNGSYSNMTYYNYPTYIYAPALVNSTALGGVLWGP